MDYLIGMLVAAFFVWIFAKALSPDTKTDIATDENGKRTEIVRDTTSAAKTASQFFVMTIVVAVIGLAVLVMIGSS
jgi:anaerobic C4-dicarboxylate transporter